jgi:hypothetical protein
MKMPRFLQRQVEAAAVEVLGAALDNAIARTEALAQLRTRKLNVMDSGIWVDMDAVQIRALKGLRGALERRKQGKPERQERHGQETGV